MTEALVLGGVGGFIVGVALMQVLHWLGKASPPEPTASTTCVHCEAPQYAHDAETTRCPCDFGPDGTTTNEEPPAEPHAYDSINFFKPMTAEQYLKYRGLEDGGTP